MELSKVDFRGYEVYVTDLRVKERFDGLYYYDIRHLEEDFSVPCTVEEFVVENHWGTMVSTQDLTRILKKFWNGKTCTDLTKEESERFADAVYQGGDTTYEELSDKYIKQREK